MSSLGTKLVLFTGPIWPAYSFVAVYPSLCFGRLSWIKEHLSQNLLKPKYFTYFWEINKSLFQCGISSWHVCIVRQPQLLRLRILGWFPPQISYWIAKNAVGSPVSHCIMPSYFFGEIVVRCWTFPRAFQQSGFPAEFCKGTLSGIYFVTFPSSIDMLLYLSSVAFSTFWT